MPKSPVETDALAIDVVSDVVCPWCFIGKRRLEKAVAQRPDIPVGIRWRQRVRVEKVNRAWKRAEDQRRPDV